MTRVFYWFTLLVCAGCALPPKSSRSIQERIFLEQSVVKLLEDATAGLRTGSAVGLVRAESALELARELSPDDPRIIDGLGCVAYRRGDISGAKQYFQEALKRAPSYDRAYAHLAAIAEGEGERLAAVALLTEATKRNPLNVRARNNLAALLHQMGSRDPGATTQAKEEIQKAVRSVPKIDKTLERNLELISGDESITPSVESKAGQTFNPRRYELRDQSKSHSRL